MHFVMPENFWLSIRWCGDSLCVAILNAAEARSRQRLENIADAEQRQTHSNGDLLRERRAAEVTAERQRYLSASARPRARTSNWTRSNW